MFILELFLTIDLLAALFYISMIYTSPAMLLLTITSTIYTVASIIYLVIVRRRIDVKILAPIGVCDVGQAMKIRVIVNSKNTNMIGKAQFSLLIRNCYQKDSLIVSFKASDVMKGENVFDYEVQFKDSGCYEIGVKKVYIYDFAGILFIQKKLGNSTYVQVLPAITEIPVRLSEPVRNFYGEADIYDEEKSGMDNSETLKIREYIPGDRIQSIHWKLSAKMENLMVKEMSLPKACPVVLFLEYKKGKVFDSFLQIIASISFSLVDIECPHYIAWYDGDTHDVRRIRVDSHEGYYQFYCTYLSKPNFNNSNQTVRQLYNDKYKSERYMYGISIMEDLSVLNGDNVILKTTENTLKKDLGGMEIVL